jgi:hypothetical protein
MYSDDFYLGEGKMKSFFFIVMIVGARHVYTTSCEISAEFRCMGGRVGTIQGKGATLEDARNNARERARSTCGGRVDYVRFLENTATC